MLPIAHQIRNITKLSFVKFKINFGFLDAKHTELDTLLSVIGQEMSVKLHLHGRLFCGRFYDENGCS